MRSSMRIDTEKIKHARELKGWTQGDLAVRIGRHESTVSNVENGHYASPRTVKLICNEVGLKIKDVVIEESEAAAS